MPYHPSPAYGGRRCPKGYDERRTRYLTSEGYRVLRVQNVDVYRNLTGALDMILMALESKA